MCRLNKMTLRDVNRRFCKRYIVWFWWFFLFFGISVASQCYELILLKTIPYAEPRRTVMYVVFLLGGFHCFVGICTANGLALFTGAMCAYLCSYKNTSDACVLYPIRSRTTCVMDDARVATVIGETRTEHIIEVGDLCQDYTYMLLLLRGGHQGLCNYCICTVFKFDSWWWSFFFFFKRLLESEQRNLTDYIRVHCNAPRALRNLKVCNEIVSAGDTKTVICTCMVKTYREIDLHWIQKKIT